MKPMKSADLAKYDNDLSKLRYPLIAQPKLDGLRCIINHGVALSNNLEPFRNKFLQAWAKGWDNMDGELIVGPATGGNVLGRTQSGIMAFEGEPDFTFHWFDRPRTERGENYTQRLRSLKEPREPRVLVVDHQWCHDSTELSLYESECVAEGYEGVMTRDPEEVPLVNYFRQVEAAGEFSSPETCAQQIWRVPAVPSRTHQRMTLTGPLIIGGRRGDDGASG